MPKCKFCSKQLQITIKGYRHFCPPPSNCKKLHRQQLSANRQKRFRDRNAKNMTNTTNVTQNGSKKDEKSIGYKGDFERFGSIEWYKLAEKYCCNFEVKLKENYCITLFYPQTKFISKCSECVLGIALFEKY